MKNINISTLKKIQTKHVFYTGLITLVAGVLLQIVSRMAFMFKFETPIIFSLSTICLTVGTFLVVASGTFAVQKYMEHRKNGTLKIWIEDLKKKFHQKVEPLKSKKEIKWEKDEEIKVKVDSLMKVYNNKS